MIANMAIPYMMMMMVVAIMMVPMVTIMMTICDDVLRWCPLISYEDFLCLHMTMMMVAYDDDDDDEFL